MLAGIGRAAERMANTTRVAAPAMSRSCSR
jgi:hypothetical protein